MSLVWGDVSDSSSGEKAGVWRPATPQMQRLAQR